jgi:hypothetical protein
MMIKGQIAPSSDLATRGHPELGLERRLSSEEDEFDVVEGSEGCCGHGCGLVLASARLTLTAF